MKKLFLLLLIIANIPAMAQSDSEKAVQRKKLYGLLGKLPDRNRPIKVQVVSREETGEVIIEQLVLDLNGLEPVPAYFIKPKNSIGKIPVVLFNHSHFAQVLTRNEPGFTILRSVITIF